MGLGVICGGMWCSGVGVGEWGGYGELCMDSVWGSRWGVELWDCV